MRPFSAKNVFHNTDKPLQIYIVGTAILAVAVALAGWKAAAALIIGAFAAWRVADSLRQRREAEGIARSYAWITGPVLIFSTNPAEPLGEVEARAADFREQLRLSGNPYAEKIPIVPYPYKPMIYGVGQLTSAWNIYQRECGEALHVANLQWADNCPPELKSIFLNQVMPPQSPTI